ncbi:MAG TPA: SDR family oxidoreductase [Salinisphaeraceae bacterium]|nr:SDR family oxidoreductase [Salinisphaeraceae bacterium]
MHAAHEPPIALVTGAGSGIGRACAIALNEAGFELALAGRRQAPLDAVAGHISGRPLVVPTDVSDKAAVEHLFTRIEQHFGRLDLLFNNAGIFPPGREIDTVSEAEWRAAVEINLNGSFFCSQGAFALMKRQQPRGGRIINNGSISAHTPRPGSVAYTATKHAITGLTKTLALDGRAHDIACAQIDIGNAASAMTDAMQKNVPQADGTRRAEPVMAVDNVARTLVYMATLPAEANAQFVTVMATKMPFIGRG